MNVFIALKWTHFLFLFGVRCGKNTLIFTNSRDQNTLNRILNQQWFPLSNLGYIRILEKWYNFFYFHTSWQGFFIRWSFIDDDLSALLANRLFFSAVTWVLSWSCSVISCPSVSDDLVWESSIRLTYVDWRQRGLSIPMIQCQWLPMGLNLFFVWFSRNFNENISCPMVNYS